MPRIRTLKPEIWMSPQVMNLSFAARLLFIGLITQADDEGRGTADPRRLKAAIFGGDDLAATQVSSMLEEVVGMRLAVVYEAPEHGALYELCSWHDHQKIDKARKSSYPSPKSPNSRRSKGEPASNEQRTVVGDRILSEGSEGSQDQTGGTVRDPPARADDLDQFDRLKSAYPRGIWPQSDWLAAEHDAQNRVADGATWAELIAGAERYAKQCAARDCGTKYVLSPRRFFTVPECRWRDAFPLPEGGVDQAHAELERQAVAAESR